MEAARNQSASGGLQATPLWVTRKQAGQAQGRPLDCWRLEGGPHIPVRAECLPGLSFPAGASAHGSRTPGLHEGGLHPGCHEEGTLPGGDPPALLSAQAL